MLRMQALGIGLAILAWPVAAQVPPGTEWAVAVGESFLRKMDAGDFAGAAALVGPQMKAAGVTAAALDGAWKQISGGARLTGLRASAVNEVQGNQVVDLAAQFGDRAQWFRVSVDHERLVEGFRIVSQDASQWNPPLYTQRDAFEEVELTVGVEGWPLGGTLTLPRSGPGRAPVVVLVHGSGPHDRNETIGAQRPFQDLAWGLASNDVAVLRYEKRTWKHGPRLARQPITVDEEVIEDALTALAKVRTHPGVDPTRVFLLGHSLGGMLAPEIAVRDGRLAGVILLAGSPRPLPELVLEQLAYLQPLPDNASPAAQQQLEQMRATMQRLQRKELPPTADAGGAPASYFYDLAERDPLRHLAALASPVLVLQGGRDYQVTRRDYELWQKALEARSDAQFRFYPDLNHLFVIGQGMAMPTEYMSGRGHVDARVIADIAAFVKQQ